MVCELELSLEASISSPLKLQVGGYYLLSEQRVLLPNGVGRLRGKVGVTRKGSETARCRVFCWGLGGGNDQGVL